MSKYANRSLSEILESMLSSMPDDYIKSPGTFVHDLSKTYAIETEKIEQVLADIWSKFDISNLKGEELEKRVFQLKGLKRKKATHSIGELLVTGNGEIKIGNLFETPNGVQFQSLENKNITGRGAIKIKAIPSGEIGNVGANSITLIPVTIQGIKSCTNPKATFDGFDEEKDISLLERYYIAVQTPATSGNIYHYQQWAREVEGVGGSRVFPLWNGNNTVKIVILNDIKQPASPELVTTTQNYIDPKGEDNKTWGAGCGVAPIGAYCTVESAVEKILNINLTIKKENTVSLETLKKDIEKNIVEYLKTIAFKKNYVSYALISNVILGTAGVVEWLNFTLNEGVTNIFLEDNEVAILGVCNIDER